MSFKATIFVALGGLVLFASLSSGSELATVAAVSFACAAVVVSPFVLNDWWYLDRPIWLLGCVAIVIGLPVRSVGSLISTSWRSFFYDVGYPSGSSLTFIFLSCVVMTIGYFAGFSSGGIEPRGSRFDRLFGTLDAGRFAPALIVGSIGLLSTVAFISRTGGLDLANLSTKRGIFSDLESGATSGSLIILRALNELPLSLIVLMLGAKAVLGTDMVTRRVGSLVWLALALVGLTIPFISSQREVLVGFFIVGVMVVLRRGEFQSFRLLAGTVVVVLLFGLISEFRQSRTDDFANVSPTAVAAQAADGLFRNRNLADLSKTAAVIDAIPETLQLDSGRRQFGSLLGVVPRAVWPSKPVIGAGPEVSSTLYDNPNSGIPPGLIAESYWSFGWGGLVVITLVGLVAGLADRSISRCRTGVGYAAWVLILSPLLLDSLGVGLGNAFTGVVVRLLQVLFCAAVLGAFAGTSGTPYRAQLSEARVQ